jgi:hypothetical protein
MALVYSAAGKNTILDSGLPGTLHAQLHTGNPTSSGTANVSSETTRKSLTIGSASSGRRSNTNAAEWAPIVLSGTETLSHVSYWTASSGGTCIAYGSLTTARSGVVNGDTVRIPIGDADFDIVDP